MNSRPMETTSLVQISPCWIFENRNYRYVENGRKSSLTLPTIEKEYLPVLDKMNVPYREVDGKYEYWKKGCFEEKEVSLPLYRIVNGKYKFTKRYTGTVVTSETMEAAQSICKDVEKAISVFKLEREKEETIQYLKKLLAEEDAVGVDYKTDPILKHKHYDVLDFITAKDHIRIFPVKALMNEERMCRWRNYCWDLLMDEDEIDYTLDTQYIAIFDMNRIQKKDNIQIKVPAGKKGLYIGRQAWQLKKWSRSIGVMKINVEEAE